MAPLWFCVIDLQMPGSLAQSSVPPGIISKVTYESGKKEGGRTLGRLAVNELMGTQTRQNETAIKRQMHQQLHRDTETDAAGDGKGLLGPG